MLEENVLPDGRAGPLHPRGRRVRRRRRVGSPPQLFALVPTADLAAAEPALLDQLDDGHELTPVEQGPLPPDIDGGSPALDEFLATTSWPPAVSGCVLVQQIVVLPPEAESTLDDALVPLLADRDAADSAARAAAEAHPDRREAPFIVGVLRDGTVVVLMQLRPAEAEDPFADDDIELLTYPDLAPNLVERAAGNARLAAGGSGGLSGLPRIERVDRGGERIDLDQVEAAGGMLAGLVAVARGHEERAGAGLRAADQLVLDAADLADVAGRVDGAGAGDELSADSSPGLSLSTTARLNISPADGPPMSARLKSTVNGTSGTSTGVMPR